MPPEEDKDQRLNEMVNALYGDLHRIAVRHLRNERADHTLQPTALLHEAYLKLSGDRQREFKDRTHFMAVAYRVMRQVLVDYARSRAAQKRGGPGQPEENADLEALPQLAANREGELVDILRLNQAIDALSRHDPALAELIEMRYFGGMTAEETALALSRSPHIVRHDLRLAQAWLRRELKQK
jgi:RNA polymerase sigma factor (TIGR02999 family)